MTERRRDGRKVLGLVFVTTALVLVAASARAHEDPPLCNQTGPAIVIGVFRADGTTAVVGSVLECDTITYRATLQKANPDDDSICAFSGGVFTLTTPDGVVHTLNANVPCIGGEGPAEGCDDTVNGIEGGPIPYIIDTNDVDPVTGLITANANYTGGVAHDNTPNTPGVAATSPKSTPVIPCIDNDPCTDDICDTSVPGSAECVFIPTDCNDNNACTTEQCDPATGDCVFTDVICEDNDLCTTNSCDPQSGCVFPPIPPCDDNDPCTDDFCDPATGCQSVPNNNPACVGENHFQCYEIKPFAFGRRTVSVQDRFFDSTVSLRGPTHMCAPADKNGEDPTAPDDPEHLTGFKVTGNTSRVLNQPVTNQFGTVTLDLIRRTHLMVPTAKDLLSPPGPLPNPVTDHFQCYNVRRSSGTPRFTEIPNVTVDDQLGTHVTRLRRPRYLCLPANKNDEDPSAPANPNALLCYRTRTRFGEVTAFLDNQFLAQQVRIIRRLELCVPSVLEGSTTTTTAPPVTTTSAPVVTTTSAAPTTSSTSTTLPGSASQAFLD